MLEQTERLISSVQEWSLRECGEGITYLPSTSTRKERVARRRQRTKEITVGPVGNVLRIESTINDPGAFRAHRRKQGASKDTPLLLLPIRKGIADTTLRARVSQDINNRFADHVATTRSSQTSRSVLDGVTKRKRRRRRSVRALEPTGKDLELLSAIADPCFTVGGLCNPPGGAG